MFIMIGVSILFISSITSIYLLLISFKPIEECKFFKKIKGSTDNNNLIFYKHISKYDFNGYKEALSKKYNIDDIDNNQYALDIINQILINSKTAVRKYNIADSAIKILMIGFSSYLIMLLLYFVFKYF